MRILSLLLVTACGHSAAVVAAPTPVAPPPTADPAFEPLRPLVGHWHGEDPDRHSSGDFTLQPELGGKVLVRRSTNDGPQGHHEDLMIVFASPAGLRATYFDNEGHTIDYSIVTTADRIELISDRVANQPQFRLRYDVKGAELAIDFAIAMPGSDDFKHYTGGTVHRVAS
jgi:hypothetical protein